jgi:hypothetical protein
MRREIPAVRILPMSDRIKGFNGRSIAQVQEQCFLRDLPSRKGRYRYQSTGLKASPGTIVLFQFQARIIASAVFIRDEKFDSPTRRYGGEIHFEPGSFRTFDPLGVEAMQKVWPGFRGFGHVKQRLNPTCYPMFKRRLKHVMSPEVT